MQKMSNEIPRPSENSRRENAKNNLRLPELQKPELGTFELVKPGDYSDIFLQHLFIFPRKKEYLMNGCIMMIIVGQP